MNVPMHYVGGSDDLEESIRIAKAMFEAEDAPCRVEVRDGGGNVVFWLEK